MDQQTPNVEAVTETDRIISLDALRGFDMFWIVGGDALFQSLRQISGSDFAQALAEQFRHASWEGFVFYDLIFPLFVFIIGISTVFSLDKIMIRDGVRAAHQRIVRRSVLLFLLGVFYDGGVAEMHRENILCGVLQRLALSYFFTGLLYCHFRLKGLVTVFLTVIIGYWALLSFVPVPDTGEVSFAPEKNWPHYVDRIMPPYHDSDAEGYLSTFPAVASCLLGVFAGTVLKKKSLTQWEKVLWLVVIGAILTILGYLWGLQFPVIKRLWTSSYVLVAGGYSFLLLGLFYLVVDVWRLRGWAAPFVWIGCNPLTIYLAGNIVDAREVAARFVGGDIQVLLGPYGRLAVTVVCLGLVLLLARVLYRKQVFLRV